MLSQSCLKTGDTNASESYNAVLKRLQEWKERPVDVLARAFSLLSQYHDIEILRGRYGLGDLTLKSHLKQVRSERFLALHFLFILYVMN